jgi:hypothetical protein
MTNEEILDKQVEALEKLIQLKQAVIEELENKISKMELERLTIPYPHQINIPWIGGGVGGAGGAGYTNTCPDGLHHQYPSMWGGTTPPSCSRCGQSQPQYGSGWTTVSSTTPIDATDPNNVVTLTTAVKK